MKNLCIETNPKVIDVFNNYPKSIKTKIEHLRNLIIETAEELEGINTLEETLKWGEPSYIVKKGSTIRIDWKEKNPDQYAMYFKCTSKLVETFKNVYKDTFVYEKNRAIIFQLNDTIPTPELKQCIAAALTYHSIKQLPFLGF